MKQTTDKEVLHTQGEWKVIDGGSLNAGSGDISIVCDRKGERVHIIAKIYQGTLTRSEKLANAELIVKAVNERQKLLHSNRELLATLQNLHEATCEIEGTEQALSAGYAGDIIKANEQALTAINNAKNLQP